MKDKRRVSVYTSETIDSVISGLDVQSNDSVWSVGKSGDVAIAMLEFAKFVTVNEPREEQRAIISDKMRYLKNGSYTSFNTLSDIVRRIILSRPELKDEFNSTQNLAALQRRKEYFSLSRFGDIRDRMANESTLQITYPTKIFRKRKGSFGKLYLSNVIQDNMSLDVVRQEIDGYADRLSIGGLMYVSNHVVLADPSKYVMLSPEVQKIKAQGVLTSKYFADDVMKSLLPSNMEFEPSLTEKAWQQIRPGDVSNPAVYRRVR